MNSLKKLVALLLICSLLLTGCSTFGGSVEELLVAPSLSEDQSRALDCVKQSVGSSIKLSYPKKGEYKNPIIFFDLTGDGVDEAIVFYTKKDEVNVNFSICQKNGSAYKVIYQNEGVGNQILKVDFAHVTHLSYYNMLVTWNAFNQTTNFFSLYGFEDTRINELLTKEGQEVLHADLDDDLFEELVFITRVETDGTSDLAVYKHNQAVQIKQLCYTDLDAEMLQYRNITLQKDRGSCTIYIDGMVKDNNVATQAFMFEKGVLSPILPKSDSSVGLLGSSIRSDSAVYCADIFEDNVVDVPVAVTTDSEGCRYVTWNCFDDNGRFVYNTTTFDCPALSLRFAIPPSISREITFALNSEKGQLTILNSNGDVMALFVMLPLDESVSTYYSNGYSLLAEKGLYTYVFHVEEAGVQSGLNDQIIRHNTSVTQ